MDEVFPNPVGSSGIFVKHLTGQANVAIKEKKKKKKKTFSESWYVNIAFELSTH